MNITYSDSQGGVMEIKKKRRILKTRKKNDRRGATKQYFL
jgi:hypothetical protein